MWRKWLFVWVLTMWVGGNVAVPAGTALRCLQEQCWKAYGPYSTANSGSFGFFLDDQDISIEYSENTYFEINCKGGAVLESPALPCFMTVVQIPAVTFTNCLPPTRSSYVQVLATLNITLAPNDTQAQLTLDRLPSNSFLDAHHFEGLTDLSILIIEGDTWPQGPPHIHSGFVSALQNLQVFNLENARLDLPIVINETAEGKNVQRLPEELIALPKLKELTMFQLVPIILDDHDVANLRKLKMSAPSVSLQVVEVPRLEFLALTHWAEKRPPPLAQCDELATLDLAYPTVESLPVEWVAKCPCLRSIDIYEAKDLKELPSELLKNATALTHISLRYGVLDTLPSGIFDEAPNLLEINLMINFLRVLPSDIFLATRALRSLNLSRNKFKNSSGLRPLESLTSLVTLDLSFNHELGNLCTTPSDPSLLQNLENLTSLALSYTRVTHTCRDWRENMLLLETLDLRDTDIKCILNADFYFKRNVSARLLLDRSPVTSLEFFKKDYEKQLMKTAMPFARLNVTISKPIKCDCSTYWIWLAMHHAVDNHYTPNRTFITNLRCNSTTLLSNITSPDQLVCNSSSHCGQLPRGCICEIRPDLNYNHLTRVICNNTSLRSVPRLPNTKEFYDLLLQKNNISELHAADLPSNIRMLDLRNNSLTSFDVQTAVALVSKPKMLYLSGNPLECSCILNPLLFELHDNFDNLQDYSMTTCANGGALMTALVACEPTTRQKQSIGAIIGGLLALLIVVLAVAAYMTRSKPRFFINAVLRRWGLLPQLREEPDDGRRYDAFVSFAHQDEEYVRELVTQLESGAMPYRLCLHYRDWVPGSWIPSQISESVRESRCTLALVSRHFLCSTWARAEFREAHAHALRDIVPRLVVVLLEDPAELPLDAELRSFIALHTYVRWGEPWFWEKLRNALPNPRPRASPQTITSDVPLEPIKGPSDNIPAPNDVALIAVSPDSSINQLNS